MRRIVSVALILVIFSGLNAYALETKMLETRDKIFEEAGAIQPLLQGSKDVVLMSSMYESCIVTKTQLDAYFFMVAIFNAVKGKDSIAKSGDYLMNWLSIIKKTNDVNINSLSAIKTPLEPTTEIHIKKLNGYFAELNFRIGQELKKISEIKDALNTKGKAE